mgnify:CR=1 FL=1
MNSPALRDFALLMARLVLGVVFIAHGYQHWIGNGMRRTAEQFAQSGVPQPRLSAYFAGSVELVGGAMLIIGLLTTIVAGILALMMVAAAYFVHLGAGFFASDGGIEYPLILVVLLGLIVVFGSGRVSLDKVLVDG